ncbi:hypothetical protein [Herbaspirillum robiniae]|uniref:hypothetical protein n=1 Tax=Herbaspirillum robiniae TaxID=2014887 RepID=UPI003D784A4D
MPVDDQVDRNFPLPSPFSRVRPAHALERSTAKANVWFFHSPKNNKRLSIIGDLPYFQAVLLEGDVDVIGYDIHPEPIHVRFNGEDSTFSPAMHVFRENKKPLWIDFMFASGSGRPRKEAQLQRTAEYAASKEISYKIVTEVEAQKRQVFFDNWMMFCAAIVRCNGLDYQQVLKSVHEC